MNSARLPLFTAFPITSLMSVLHSVLALGFMLNTFIGTNPFGAASLADRAEGNPLDRLVILGLTGLAMLVLLLNWRELPAIILRGSGVWLIVGIAIVSVTWSQHPDLTLRRSILFLCSIMIAAGTAIGVRDLSKLHRAFGYFMTAIVLLNLFVIGALPHIGIEQLGARGIYSQKNVAGLVAMIAILVIATLIFHRKTRTLERYYFFGMLGFAFIFLILTKSKTSLGLTVVMLAAVGGLALVEKGGPALILAGFLASLFALMIILVGAAAFDFDIERIASALLSDTSFTGRDELWAFVYRAATEYPNIGYGYGAFWDVGIGADPLQRVEPGAWLGEVAPGVINQAHNGYLDLWVQLGLPAMLLGVATVSFAIIVGCVAVYLLPRSHRDRIALVTMVALLIVYLLHNLTESSLFARGLILCNVTLPVLFIFARLENLLGARDDSNGPIHREYV